MRLSLLCICLVAGSACPKELSETFEESNREMEAHRIGGAKVPQADKKEEPEFAQSVAAKAEPKEDFTGRPLQPGSAEAKLFAEIVARLRCVDPACSQESLTRIRQARDAFGPVFEKLLDGQQVDRVTAEVVKVAGILRVKRSVSALGRIAISKPGSIREEAIWSLGSIGGQTAMNQLRSLSRLGLDIPTREKICRAYGTLKSPDAVTDIADLVRASSVRVKVACALALGLIKSDRGVPVLAGMLQGTSRDVRQAALRSLRAIGTPTAQNALRQDEALRR